MATERSIRFKPLHSGAFLLTLAVLLFASVIAQVSNPFIAGHSFLHYIGQFVCTFDVVSNPFIAGHSFLLILRVAGVYQLLLFQIPS